MTAFESETIIRFNEESREAVLYTASIRVAKKLMNNDSYYYHQVKLNKTFKDTNGKITGWEFIIPKTAVRIKPGRYTIYVGGK